jgi:hypothetical protein
MSEKKELIKVKNILISKNSPYEIFIDNAIGRYIHIVKHTDKTKAAKFHMKLSSEMDKNRCLLITKKYWKFNSFNTLSTIKKATIRQINYISKLLDLGLDDSDWVKMELKNLSRDDADKTIKILLKNKH